MNDFKCCQDSRLSMSLWMNKLNLAINSHTRSPTIKYHITPLLKKAFILKHMTGSWVFVSLWPDTGFKICESASCCEGGDNRRVQCVCGLQLTAASVHPSSIRVRPSIHLAHGTSSVALWDIPSPPPFCSIISQKVGQRVSVHARTHAPSQYLTLKH